MSRKTGESKAIDDLNRCSKNTQNLSNNKRYIFTVKLSVLTSTSVQMGLELSLCSRENVSTFFSSPLLSYIFSGFRAAFKVFCVNSLCSDFFSSQRCLTDNIHFFRDLQRVWMRKQQRAVPTKNWRKFRARTHRRLKMKKMGKLRISHLILFDHRSVAQWYCFEWL